MKPKRIISLLVAVCMVVAMLPVGAFAADTQVYTSGDYQYTLNDDGTATITKYTATEQTLAADNYQVEIPSELDGHSVTIIGQGVFSGASSGNFTNENAEVCQKIKTIEIPESMTYIRAGAFYECKSLKEISIPENVTKIEWMGFTGCENLETVTFEGDSKITTIESECFENCKKLTGVVLPSGITDIRWLAFNRCEALGNIVIPESTTMIYRKAFYDCGLTAVTLPASVEGIEAAAFGKNNQLETIYYTGTATQWKQLCDTEYKKISNTKSVGINRGNDTQSGSGDDNNNEILFKENIIKCAHTVNFDNGTIADVQKVIVPYNETVTAPKAPVINGYKLAGYYTDDTYTNQFDFSQKITTDTPVFVKWEKIPATLTTSTEKLTCTVGEPATVEFAIATNGDAGNPAKVSLTVSDQDAVDSLKVNGQAMQDKEFTYSLSHLIGMTGKAEAVFNKAGTYTMTATLAVEGNEPVVRTVEVTVKEKPVEPVVTYDLTVKDGKVKVDGNSVTAGEKGVYEVAENAKVEVTFDQSTLSDAQMFDQWSITPASVLNAVDPKSEAISFTMPAEKVTIEAMTRDATIESEGPGVLGTAAMIGVGVAGTAVLGYQSYMIGTELYLDYILPAGAAIPQNYGELALLLWNDAGQPAPAAVLAADATDEQKALTWAVENQLISADKAADASVDRWEVIDAWNKAQEMKKA